MSVRIETARALREITAAREIIRECIEREETLRADAMNPSPNLEAWFHRIEAVKAEKQRARGILADGFAKLVREVCQSGDEAAINAAHAYMDAFGALELQARRLAEWPEDR